jgi:hypothetical protein
VESKQVKVEKMLDSAVDSAVQKTTSLWAIQQPLELISKQKNTHTQSQISLPMR